MNAFKVEIPDSAISDLRRRLETTRWPDSSPRGGWDEGTELAYIRKLSDYWRDGFDWPAQERLINFQHHYRVDVGDLRIHCTVTKAERVAPRPLLLLAGWPSTFFDYYKLVPLLSNSAEGPNSFDVICASLPGFGFSDRPREPGMHCSAIGKRLVRMMSLLGYDRFAIHATDFGARVAAAMALDHPSTVVGLHFGAVPPAVKLGDEPQFSLDSIPDGMGYYAIQATRPQTIAYGLADSPIAQAAWILEKWRAWSDCAGDLSRRYTDDELLTTVSLFWFTNTGGSSARLYRENHLAPLPLGSKISVPAGFSVFPHPPQRSRKWAEKIYQIAYWRDMPSGGHFPAMEEPAMLAEEIKAFFGQLGF